MDLAAGNHLTLSTLKSTVHLGSHLDAPSHYDPDGMTIDQVDLSLCLGRCQVIETKAEPGTEIGREELLSEPQCSRILLRTGSHPDPDHWGGDFCGISPALIDEFSQMGVRLLGVDTPSVDLADSKDLQAHDACRRGAIWIMEGLVLTDADPGFYELIALPLRLEGFDASPVRAVLRPLGDDS
jgi:arylformamidase